MTSGFIGLVSGRVRGRVEGCGDLIGFRGGLRSGVHGIQESKNDSRTASKRLESLGMNAGGPAMYNYSIFQRLFKDVPKYRPKKAEG